MSQFNRIVVAIDLDTSADQVLAMAGQMASDHHASMVILHVMYTALPVYSGFMGEGAYIPAGAIPDEASIRKDVTANIAKKVQEMGLQDADIKVEFGRAADVIVDVAETEGADLIVLGSHGRHGVGLLLGSTANAVLHRAKVDVLAVRIKKDDQS